jgi:hypothetical protein
MSSGIRSVLRSGRFHRLNFSMIALAVLIVASPLALRLASAWIPAGPVNRVVLHSPGFDAIDDESSLILGWRDTRRASGYLVFLSPTPIENRTVEELLADPAIARKETTANSMPLNNVVRGETGTTSWFWAVAAKDARTGGYSLSASSTFRAVKTFEASSPNPLLVTEAARGTAPASSPADDFRVHLSNGYQFDPVTDGPPAVSAALQSEPLRSGETGGFLVQLRGPVQPDQRETLVAAGAALVSYVPNFAYIARMSSETREAVEKLEFVRWVGPYEPAFKLSGQPAMSAAGPGKLVVLLYPDADMAIERAALQALGGKIDEATDSGRNKILRVSLDTGHLASIARRKDVAWIEPWHELHTKNASAQWVVQTNVSNNRRLWDMGLRGEGQIVHTSDSGIRTSHYAFRDTDNPITTFGQYPAHRKVVAYEPAVVGGGVVFGDASGASYHGTHTAGTIVGNDSPFAANANDGMAPNAKIWFHDGGALTNSIIAPGDLNLLFQPPYDGNAAGVVRVSSNSWGGDAAGAYTVHSMTADQFMWDHKDFLVNFSNGNAGPQPATVGSPASMKNGISSGASQNGANSGTYAFFSSQGPAADGRLKPTVVSPGDGVVPATGLQSANGANDTGYQGLLGTSMSCPSGTGAVLLMRQYLMEGWYPTGVQTPANAFTPSGALLKAMTISSTDNDMSGNPIPNNIVGWGRIKTDNILYFPGDAARTALVDATDGLTTGDFVEYEIEVAGNAVPLKITLCWFDREGSPAAARTLVNDLDLTVIDPLNVSYTGNVLAGGESVPGGLRDSINVEEGVRHSSPLAGTWRVRVTANNIPFGPQPFALAISGALSGDNGLVQIDRLRYGRDDVVEIRVEDLNAVGPVTVDVSSDTELSAEEITLNGVNGVFTGTIPTTALAADADGLLSVSHGDVITVTYADANPVATVSVSATADFTGPLITNVGGTGDDITRIVTWDTDAPASSRVYYGTTPALGQATPLDGDLVTAHAATVTGLLPETTYYFDVESHDQAGNVTRDDAGGNHYQFTTSRSGDILLVIGDTSFPLEASYTSALSLYGWDVSLLKGETIEHPPLGDLSSGLRSKTAVLWQVGYEQYPAVADAARDSLALYLDGGGRFSICTHDMAWAFTDPASGFSTPARIAWMQNYMHVSFVEDPATWPANLGVAGDPISGSYPAGVLYTPQRAGGAGDEISLVAGTGTGSFVWTNTDATVGDISLRWENGVPNGSPETALWGGTPTKLVTNCYEWAQIDDKPSRDDILDKTLIWLIGHDHPDVVVGSPNGGETVTGNSVTVSWTETAYGGTAIGGRVISYTSNGGASWNVIESAAGPPPYEWDVSALPNSPNYRVRVAVTDDATPALRGSDESDAAFALARTGGDTQGPVIVAGSIAANPNPIDNAEDATLEATISDAAFGNSTIAEAEWSVGETAEPPGNGEAMSGSFDGPVVDVSATVPAGTVSPGDRKFWVRGRDAAGIWGAAAMQEFRVNGDEVSGVGDGPVAARFQLDQNLPNPFNPTTTIRFNLPRPADTELVIYNVQGRKIRTLIAGHRDAGAGTAVWDGSSDVGEAVTSGIYFYTLVAGDYRATKKMVMIK